MILPRFSSLLLFVWLTVSYAVVHLVISFWGMSLLQTFFSNRAATESLKITSDGEPIIQGWNEFQVANYRQLDGTLIDNTLGLETVNPITFGVAIRQNRSEPMTWSARIGSFIDYQSPMTSWYLVVPPHREGTAYFVGYDARSRHRVGYLSLNGFSTQLPGTESCFPIETYAYSSFSGVTAATQNLNGGIAQPFEPWEGAMINSSNLIMENASLDAVWILSKGTVYEIQLRSRSVRTILTNRPDLRFLTRNTVKREGKSYLELLLCSETELVILDPKSGQSQSVSLELAPKEGRNELYQLTNGKRLLVRTSPYHANRPYENQIYWLDEEGQIQRRAEWRSPSTPKDSTILTSVGLWVGIPSPVMSLGIWLVAAFEDGFLESKTTTGRMSELFMEFKIWFVLNLMTGVATGWACRRRERDVFGTSNWVWPILVGACSWFGWMGYICLRPLPARLPHGRWLPSRPEPVQPLGTEIFA